MLFFTIRILGSRHGPAQLISREVEQVKTISYGIGKANVTKNIAEIWDYRDDISDYIKSARQRSHKLIYRYLQAVILEIISDGTCMCSTYREEKCKQQKEEWKSWDFRHSSGVWKSHRAMNVIEVINKKKETERERWGEVFRTWICIVEVKRGVSEYLRQRSDGCWRAGKGI